MNIVAGSLGVCLLIYSGTFNICTHKQPWFTLSRLGLCFAFMKTSFTILALSIANGLPHHSAVTPLLKQLFLHAEQGF